MIKTVPGESGSKPVRRRHSLLRLVLLFVVLILSIRLLLPQIAFRPLRNIIITPEVYGLPFEDITLTTSDGVKIAGWYIPAPRPRGTLLFFHGNSGNISHRMDSIRIFHDLEFSVFIIDYRGYGRSEGRPSISGVTKDAIAAWKYLTGERGISPDKIVVFGRSIGGAVAMQLMRHAKPRALILESTFSSLSEMVRIPFLVPVARFVIGDALNSVRIARRLTVPVLCLHSPDDNIVPYRLGRRLYESVASEKTFVELRGDHNMGFLESIGTYRSALDKFLTKHFGAMEPPAPNAHESSPDG
jgi:fermentation-respiration switch protein FrsA (DUF1100 family)